MNYWLALVIGNSRLHWALFKNNNLITVWHSYHLANPVNRHQLPLEIFPPQIARNYSQNLPIYLASVVAEQTALWQNYQNLQQITLKDIPLGKIYPTLGIDRALAIWGGGQTYGYPCLVIDAGTALTLTGVDSNKILVGGAILPGLRTQLQSLNQKTAALPEISLPQTLPPRWANNTRDAIASGVIYTIISGIQSFIEHWQANYPHSSIIITGGDGIFLSQYLSAQTKIAIDPNLVFWGIKFARERAESIA